MGRVFSSLPSLILVVVGFGFMFYAFEFIWDDVESYSWDRVPCQIVKSRVVELKDADKPYRFEVEYAYQVGQRRYRGNVYKNGYEGGHDYGQTYDLVEQYPVDSNLTCLVNPEKRFQAVLASRSLSRAWMFIIVPLVFVCIGLYGIYASWRRTSDGIEMISSDGGRKNKRIERIHLIVFFGIFGAFGAFGAHSLAIKPWLAYHDAKGWQAVPCVIESSKYDPQADRMSLLFRYEYEGKEYCSSRYSLNGNAKEGSGWQTIESEYPKDTRTTCYVNPDKPHEAVLNRDLSVGLLTGLMALVFPLVGLGGVIYVVVAAYKDTMLISQTGVDRRFAQGDGVRGGPVTMISPGRVTKVLGLVGFAVLWNGFVSIFVTIIVKSHIKGDPDWIPTILMIPFVVVGIFLIGSMIHQLLEILNPKVRLTLSASGIRLGEPLAFSWEVLGRSWRLEDFCIVLEGIEKATYQRGTDTVTDENVFTTIRLVQENVTPGQWRANGEMITMIPPDKMHSFKAPHNEIYWQFRAEGRIRHWPDVKDKFPITILPAERGQ